MTIRQWKFNGLRGYPCPLKAGDFNLFIITTGQKQLFIEWVKKHNLTILFSSEKAVNLVHPAHNDGLQFFIVKV